MTDYSQRLNAKVKAYNRVNAKANELYPKLKEIFRPFVGKKITTQHGWIAKLAPQIDALRKSLGESWNGGFQLYPSWGGVVLTFNLKCSEPDTEYSVCYAEASIPVGDFGRNGIPQDHLAGLRTDLNLGLRTDYDADEVRRLRKEAQEKMDAARAAEYALYPFGKFDQ